MMRKRIISLLIALCFCLATFACAQETDAIYYAPILEDWGATNAQDLYQRILDYWGDASDWEKTYTTRRRPMSIRLGGTRNELIDDHHEWDIAVVSSKDIDLQALANEGVICRFSYIPDDRVAVHQWLLPEAVQRKLPVHPLYSYDIFCYSYDVETDEAVLILCNDKDRPGYSRRGCAFQLLKGRTAHETRAVEGLCRANERTQEGVPERTVDELLQSPEDWDYAELFVEGPEDLVPLDQAGFLYDFSQSPYWVERAPQWSLPNGLFSQDGRMIAIPHDPFAPSNHGIRCFIVNANTPDLSRCLAYAEHLVKSCEWVYKVVKTEWIDEDIVEKYGDRSVCIYKDEVDW